MVSNPVDSEVVARAGPSVGHGAAAVGFAGALPPQVEFGLPRCYLKAVSETPIPRAYGVLCGVLGTLFVVGGLVLFGAFMASQAPGAAGPIPTGPAGMYFVAFAGCALIGWGGGLIGASRHPETRRILAGFTVFALVLSALYRMVVWLMGDPYVWLGDVSRLEAAVFRLLALGLLWWMPRRTASQGGD